MYNLIAGELLLEIVSADIPGMLSALNHAGIIIGKVKTIDFFTVQLCLHRRDVNVLHRIIEKRGDSYKIQKRRGLWFWVCGLWKRPFFLGGIILTFLLTVILPNRTYFTFVEGNENVPYRYILETAKEAGIGFGTLRKAVRSESVKNILLDKIPELQWVGVTTQGCVATIHVKEKSTTDRVEIDERISSIVAGKDGILDSITVTRGRSLCKPGQAVKRGDVLISGFYEEGILTHGCRAEGEIFALTNRKHTLISPREYSLRTNWGEKHTCVGIRIGKKLINLCNHSGIYGVSCVKMYLEECWVLPGDLALPIAWTFTTYVRSDLSQREISDEDDIFWMSDAAREYAVSQMTAGEILTEKVRTVITDNTAYFYADYTCREMIGQVRQEEIVEQYAKDHRTNSER